MEDYRNRPPAMVYAVDQRLGHMFEAGQALRHGTLYPELFKPMREGVMPIDAPLNTNKQALSFAAWELRLYLDTHPDDLCALNLFRQHCAGIEGPSYPCAFVEPAACGARGWTWLDDPWPWELAECAIGEGERHVCV